MSAVLKMVEPTAELPPPHNVEAEAALLGALMIDNRALSACHQLEPDHFFEPVHGEIYAAIVASVSAGRVANPVLLRPQFEHHEVLKQLGGPSYLAKLSGNSAALVGAKDFAEQVIELARARRLMAALRRAVVEIADPSSDATFAESVAMIDVELSAAVQRSDEQAIVPIARAWDSAMAYVDEVADGTREPGLKIDGLPDINQLLGTMERGDLIVIAGRPGMGKTALACTIANCAARAGLGTEFMSLEMPIQQLMLRMIADECFEYGQSFTFRQLKRGQLNATERQRVDFARERIADRPLMFFEPGRARVGQLILELRRRKRAMAARGQSLDIAIIDYLQLIRGDKDRDNLVREIGEITRDLKLAAKELGIAIVLLSQLSRAVEQREDKRPKLSDLRDSGSIEQDADAVIFLYREEYYLKASEPKVGSPAYAEWDTSMLAARDRVELIAAKVRNDETGHRLCYFFGAHQAVRGSRFHSDQKDDR